MKRNPKTMRIEERTEVGSTEGFDLSNPGREYSSTAKMVTVELGGLSTSGSEVRTERARVLMNFGEHAREIITSEIALHLLKVLESERKIRSMSGGGVLGQQTLDALKHTTLVILPMENMSGRRVLEEKNKVCLRKTGRLMPDGSMGVDPNRNWGVDWGVYEEDYNPHEEYPGEKAFSEPESRIIKKVVEELRIHAWVNVHSGMAAMFLPIDYKAQVPEDEDMLHNSRIIGSLKEKHCPSCQIGSGGATVGYRAHGTVVDYLYEHEKVPFPMTWEVMGDTKAAFSDCVRMFNPLTKMAYNDVVHRWSAATLEMVRLLPVNPKIPKYDSFSAPSMAELPVPDMQGFTDWHRERILKLKREPVLAAGSGESSGTDDLTTWHEEDRHEKEGTEEEEQEEEKQREQEEEKQREQEEEEEEKQREQEEEEGERGHGEDLEGEAGLQEGHGEEYDEHEVLAQAEAEDLEDSRHSGDSSQNRQGDRQDLSGGQGVGPGSHPQERGSVYHSRPLYHGGDYGSQKLPSNPFHFQFLLVGCLVGAMFFGFQVRKRHRAQARSRRAIRNFSGRQISLPI